MSAIIIGWLAVQAAIILPTIRRVLMRGLSADSRFSDYGLPAVIGGVSLSAATSHADEVGSDMVMIGAGLLFGMGLMAAIIVQRQQREGSQPS